MYNNTYFIDNLFVDIKIFKIIVKYLGHFW